MKEQVKDWLEEGKIDIFLGYKIVDGHPTPYCFTKEKIEELDDIVESEVRYPLEKIALNICRLNPGIKVGLLARDCTQRALNVMYVWNQLNPDDVKIVKLSCCPSYLEKHPDCSYLIPSSSREPGFGIDSKAPTESLELMNQEELFRRWMYEFQKCIKCYGCRNICPVCFCKECSLEHPDLIGTGDFPPEIPIFHLVRATHMAGRCIDCGLCEDACPADIPLRLLYRKVNEITQNIFDYKPGIDRDQPPFNVLGDKVTLEPKPL